MYRGGGREEGKGREGRCLLNLKPPRYGAYLISGSSGGGGGGGGDFLIEKVGGPG